MGHLGLVARSCEEAGADMIFADAIRTEDQIKRARPTTPDAEAHIDCDRNASCFDQTLMSIKCLAELACAE
jgi:2-methylisocitrate lyase-like PEP mutase family enzyme